MQITNRQYNQIEGESLYEVWVIYQIAKEGASFTINFDQIQASWGSSSTFPSSLCNSQTQSWYDFSTTSLISLKICVKMFNDIRDSVLWPPLFALFNFETSTFVDIKFLILFDFKKINFPSFPGGKRHCLKMQMWKPLFYQRRTELSHQHCTMAKFQWEVRHSKFSTFKRKCHFHFLIHGVLLKFSY